MSHSNQLGYPTASCVLSSELLKVVDDEKFSNFNTFKFTRIAYSSLKEKIFSFVYKAIKAYLTCKWGKKLYKKYLHWTYSV
jgi:hypothetical protein